MAEEDVAYWNRTIALDPALEWQGKTYDKIEMREPTYGELLEAQKRGTEGDMWMCSTLSGIPMQALLKAPAAVVLEATEIIQRFLARRTTRRGETS